MCISLSAICTASFLCDFLCQRYLLLVSYVVFFVSDMYCLFLIGFSLSAICTACFLCDFFVYDVYCLFLI